MGIEPGPLRSYLLAAFLEHVLLLLGHHLPLLTAQHHPLGTRHVLHVDHQLGAVQRVTVPMETFRSRVTADDGKDRHTGAYRAAL